MILLAPPAPADASAAIPQEAVQAFVDGLVPALMEDNNSPSGAVAVMQDGQLLFASGFGWQDINQRIPVDADHTLFRPGSVSKLFTWVAVMQQVEQGRLELDTDINTWLTGFRINDAFGRPVTLRNLMTHTPGFDDGSIGYLIITEAERALPLAEAMARYQPARVNPPGKYAAYSNYGAALAGLIVSNVTGKSFEDYVRENIFEPLQMFDSTFVQPPAGRLAGQMAVAYAASGGRQLEQPFEVIISFSPAGGMSASVTDVLRFGQAILNGGELDGRRILEPETVAAMLKRQFAQDERINGMGLGFYETNRNGIRLVGHDGDTAWFHSELVLDLQNSLVYYVSFGGAGGSVVRSSFKNAFYDRFYPQDETPPVPLEGFASRAHQFAGEYWFWRSNFSTIEKALSLADAMYVEDTGEGNLRLVLGQDSKQYVEIGENLFQELDSSYTLGGGFRPRLLAFERDANGTVSGFTMDEWPTMALRKKPWYERLAYLNPLLLLCAAVLAAAVTLRIIRRRSIALLPPRERGAVNAAAYAAAAHLLAGLAGLWVVYFTIGELRDEVTWSFKALLVLPIIATVTTGYLLLQTSRVWVGGWLGSLVWRGVYSIVTLCALFLCGFYACWNILGFQLP